MRNLKTGTYHLKGFKNWDLSFETQKLGPIIQRILKTGTYHLKDLKNWDLSFKGFKKLGPII